MKEERKIKTNLPNVVATVTPIPIKSLRYKLSGEKKEA